MWGSGGNKDWGRGGLWSPPRPGRLASLAEKKMGGGLGGVIVNLQKKKHDWVRIAYILEELGPQPIAQLTFLFCKTFPDRSRSSGSIAAVIVGHQKKGFSRIYSTESAIYGFYGDLPELTKATKYRWKAKISPLKGGKTPRSLKHLNEERIWEASAS